MNKETMHNNKAFRWIVIALAAVIVCVAAAIVLIQSFGVRDKTFSQDAELNHNGNIVVSPGSGNNMKIAMPADFKPEIAETETPELTGYSLTATIGPVTAENKEILWTVKWKNSTSSGGQHSGGAQSLSDSTWGEGKPVTDYVALGAETTESGESVTLTCKKDFGEQIIVTATSASDPNVTATCTVDYCRKIKAVNYTFQYGTSTMATPTVGADGVYRVDYTGEEKSYTVVCTPVYTEYTVTDTFTQSIGGKFTEAFGYAAEYSFSQIELHAGLMNGVKEPVLSADGEQYVSLVYRASMSVGNPLAGIMTEAGSLYATLTETEKQHSKIINSHEAFQIMHTSLIASGNGSITTEARNEAKAILDSYDEPTFGTFTGNIAVESIDALLSAAKSCNDAGKGIMEYTITFTGNYSTKSFHFEIGYTSNSVSAARSMKIDLPSVMF